MLDGFRVVRELGAGGSGHVYHLRAEDAPAREFAVKRIDFHSERERWRCLRELQTWIDLPEHPNLVTLRFPRLADESIYLFADYVDGGSLADWLAARKSAWRDRREPTSLAAVLDVAVQLAWGVHACHCQGLVHADVKPGNVFVTRDGRVKLGDFGIASSAGTPFEGDYPFGTESYRSPEQSARRPLGKASDVWSWAATVQRLFGVDSGLPALPPSVRTLLDRCARCAPSRRPRSALFLAQALRREHRVLIGTDHPLATPRFAQPRISRVIDRHGRFSEPWTAPDAAGLSAGLDLPREGLGRRAQAVADLAHKERRRRSLEARMADPASTQGERLQLARNLAGTHSELAVILEQLDDTWGDLTHSRQAIEVLLPWAEASIDMVEELAQAHHGYGVALQGLARYHDALGCYDAALGCLGGLPDDRPGIHERRARTLNVKGLALVEIGEAEAALPLLRESVRLRCDMLASKPEVQRGLALATMNLAVALRQSGRCDEALAQSDRSLELYRALLATQPHMARWVAQVQGNRGELLIALARPDEALAACLEAIELYRALADDDSSAADGLAWALGNLAQACMQLGRWRDALRRLLQAMRIYRRLVVSRPELGCELARTEAGVAEAQCRAGLHEAAIESADRVLARMAGLDPRADEALSTLPHALALHSKAVALDRLGRSDEAIVSWRDAIDVLAVDRSRHVSAGRWTALATAHRDLGLALLARRRDVDGGSGHLAIAVQLWRGGQAQPLTRLERLEWCAAERVLDGINAPQDAA